MQFLDIAVKINFCLFLFRYCLAFSYYTTRSVRMNSNSSLGTLSRLGEILGSNGGEYGDDCLQGCCAV
jgi:hypothetical protein